MNPPTEEQSPLGTISCANQPALSMQELALRGYLNLRGRPEQGAFIEAVRATVGIAPPLEPNTVATAECVSLLWLAPNEWLIVTPPRAQTPLQTALRAALGPLFAAVTDVSSGYTGIAVRGREARGLLARGCGVDLHPRSFMPGQCAQTLLAKADVTLVAVDASPCFQILVRRSMAAYLWRWLEHAARDAQYASAS